MCPYEVEAAEELAEKLSNLGNTEAFTRDQLLQFARILFAANCPLSEKGLQAIHQLEVDTLYSGMLVPLDDPEFFEKGTLPFQEPVG